MKNDLFIACGCLYFCLFCFTSFTNRKRVITVNFPALIVCNITFTLISYYFNLAMGVHTFAVIALFWWCLGLVSNHFFLFYSDTVLLNLHDTKYGRERKPSSEEGYCGAAGVFGLQNAQLPYARTRFLFPFFVSFSFCRFVISFNSTLKNC